MTLAIDASSPAYVGTVVAATFTITSPSFAPPSGALLLGCVNTEQAAGAGGAPTFSNSGTALTWTPIGTENVQNGLYSAAWTILASGRSLTVTATETGTTHIGLGIQMIVMTGADATTPIGANGVSNGNGNIITQTYTPTRVGSMGWVCNVDFAHSTTGTLRSDSTQYMFNATLSGVNTFIARETTPAASLSPVTVGYTTAVATSLNNTVWFEVLPSAFTPRATISNQAMKRASYY